MFAIKTRCAAMTTIKVSVHGIGFTKSDIPLVDKMREIRESRSKKHYFAIKSRD